MIRPLDLERGTAALGDSHHGDGSFVRTDLVTTHSRSNARFI